ncbi:MAG: CDP-alcohol phosphatidyltransferase family protein [Myxococcales bacterium]|nr:CDP-alcohol phosphatidyltransferase family protein [Myxococcales bacterium]MCB9737495.1 CDP-alcohol phosphatidyltransferase family protein [Deltaproteobacteria bacterium]
MKVDDATQMQLDERFDILVSRPLAGRMARTFHGWGFSADQVSMVAMLSGVLAGVCMTGPSAWPVLGALLLVTMVVVDCADGAVARLNPPSDRPWRGRMIDGFADLGTLLSVHIAMVIVLAQRGITIGGYTLGGFEIFLIGVAGFLSFTWKSSVLDDMKQRLKPSSCDHRIEEYRSQKKNLFEKFLFFFFVWYVKNSEKLTGPGRPGGYETFRQVAVTGPTHHLVAIALCALVAPIAPSVYLTYFLLTIGPGNLYLWFILARARRHAADEAVEHVRR